MAATEAYARLVDASAAGGRSVEHTGAGAGAPATGAPAAGLSRGARGSKLGGHDASAVFIGLEGEAAAAAAAAEGSLLYGGMHTTGASDLLPSNTQIFSSTVRYGYCYYCAMVGTMVTFLSLMIASGATHGAAHIGLLAGAFGGLVVGAGCTFALRMRTRLAYARALAAGEWHEGIVVFPTGDVVVRFHSLLYAVDRTIEVAYLSRAEVERTCDWRCRPYNRLKLYYLGIDAKPATLTVGESYLRDSVPTIAEFINDAKTRDASASLF